MTNHSDRSRWGNLLRRLADSTPVLAFVLSVVAFSFPSCIAPNLTPDMDIQPPKSIQIECIKSASNECSDNSKVKVVTKLFSFWNNSELSTKPEVVKKVVLTREGKKYGPLKELENKLPWMYFSEITDENKSGDTKKSPSRMIFHRGDFRNIEIQFYSNSLYWFDFAKQIDKQTEKNNTFQIGFEIDLFYGQDKAIVCIVNLENWKKSDPYFSFVGEIDCLD